jgi:hypothetical protein
MSASTSYCSVLAHNCVFLLLAMAAAKASARVAPAERYHDASLALHDGSLQGLSSVVNLLDLSHLLVMHAAH